MPLTRRPSAKASKHSDKLSSAYQERDRYQSSCGDRSSRRNLEQDEKVREEVEVPAEGHLWEVHRVVGLCSAEEMSA